MKELAKVLKWLADDIADNGFFRKDLTVWQGIIRSVIYFLYMLPFTLLMMASFYIWYILLWAIMG